jgi:CCR4-NOT transcription complex subunit 9
MSEEVKDKIYQYVSDLTLIEKREKALHKLSRCRESHNDLAPILWHSVSTIAALLQEITAIYPSLAPPKLTV